jgi:hypothetical protein
MPGIEQRLVRLQERKVAPPDVPTRAQYRPLGQLLEAVKRGQRFRPVTVADIKASHASPGGGAAAVASPARAPDSGGRATGVVVLHPPLWHVFTLCSGLLQRPGMGTAAAACAPWLHCSARGYQQACVKEARVRGCAD